jgi:hypothetical protein
MIGDLGTRGLAIVGAVLVTGVIGALVAVGGRNADAQFVQNQRHPPVVQAAAVERVVRTAPDPLTGKGSGKSATCRRRGAGPLGNPWSCVVRYASRKNTRLIAVIQQDGSYDASYVGIKGAAATGCCVDLPGAQ